MKKFTLILLFWTIFLPLIAQNDYVTVQGYVTDIATGMPVINHAVTIQLDSSSGSFYYNVVNTGQTGFYVDTVLFNSVPIPAGNMFVSTLDCNQNTLMATLSFGPGNQALSHDFQICTGTSPCNADFSWQSLGNLAVQFNDLSTGGNYTRVWQFGDGASSTLADPVHTYGAAGYYTAMLSITDSTAGCWDSIAKVIHVGDSTGGCAAMFTAVPDTANPSNIFFQDLSTGNNITSWFWDFGDGISAWITFPNNPNVNHTYNTGGTYEVCLTIRDNDSTCYSVHCDSLLVSNGSGGCQAQFTWYSDSVNTMTTVHFIDLSLGASSWLWDFGDGTPSSSLQNPVHTYASPLPIRPETAAVFGASMYMQGEIQAV
jgi:PKD repeat protein